MNDYDYELEAAENEIDEAKLEISRLKDSLKERRNLLESSDEIRQDILYKRIISIEENAIKTNEKIDQVVKIHQEYKELHESTKMFNLCIIGAALITVIGLASIFIHE